MTIAEARQMAFDILKRHPDCLRDDAALNDLIEDIADRIYEHAADAGVPLDGVGSTATD